MSTSTVQGISLSDAAARHSVSRQRMLALVKQKRVPGARMVAGNWLVPENFTISPPPKRTHPPLKITTS